MTKIYTLIIYPIINDNPNYKVASICWQFINYFDLIAKINELKPKIDNNEIIIVIDNNNILDKSHLFS
jgi:hypothetical protein